MGQKATKDNEARSKGNNAFFSSTNFLRALGGVFFTIQTDHWTNRIQTDSHRCQKLPNLADTYKLKLDDGIALVTLLHPEDLQQLAHLPPQLNQAINSREDHSVFQVIQFDLHPSADLDEPKSVDSSLRSCLGRDSFGPSLDTETQQSIKPSWWQWLKSKSPEVEVDVEEGDDSSQAESREQSEYLETPHEEDEVASPLAEARPPVEEERLPPSATLRKRLQESLESDEEEVFARQSCGRASMKPEVKSPVATEPVCVTVANEVEPPTWVRRLDNFKEDVESGTSEDEVEEPQPKRKDSQNLPAEWTHFDLGTSSSEQSPPVKSASEEEEIEDEGRKENEKTRQSQHGQSPHSKDARGKRRPQRPVNSSPNQVIKRPRRDASKSLINKPPPTPGKTKKCPPAPKSVTRSARPTPSRSVKKKRTRVLQNDDEDEEEAIL